MRQVNTLVSGVVTEALALAYRSEDSVASDHQVSGE